MIWYFNNALPPQCTECTQYNLDRTTNAGFYPYTFLIGCDCSTTASP